MSTSAPLFTTVGIVGTGAMGRGIAQIAAQAGSTVVLFDTQAAAVEKAREALGAQWNKLVEKGRLTPEQATAQKERLKAAATLADVAALYENAARPPEPLLLPYRVLCWRARVDHTELTAPLDLPDDGLQIQL